MRTAAVAVILFILMVIQSTLFQFIEIHGVKPDVILIFVISYALLRGSLEGAFTGASTGLIFDLLFGKVFGLFTLLFLYLGIIVGIFNKRLYKENIFIIIFFTFTSTFCFEFVFYFFSSFLRGQFEVLYFLYNAIFPEAVYNSVLCIPIYILVYKLDEKLEIAQRNMRRKY